MHLIHNGQAPQYLSDCASSDSAASRRYRLRLSGSAVYVLPRTRTRFRERGLLVTSAAVRPPGTLFFPNFMTLLIPVHSENN